MTDTTPNAAVSIPDWHTDCPRRLHRIVTTKNSNSACVTQNVYLTDDYKCVTETDFLHYIK